MSLTRTTLLLLVVQASLDVANAQTFRTTRRNWGRVIAGIVVGCLVLVALIIFLVMLAMRRRRLRNRATFAAASVPATGGTSGFSGFGGGKPMFGANTFQQGNQQSSPYNNQYTGQPYGGQQGYQQGSYEQHNANGANGAGFAPPSSPPPSYGNGDTLYKPPSGPPPAHTKGNENGQFVGGFRP